MLWGDRTAGQLACKGHLTTLGTPRRPLLMVRCTRSWQSALRQGAHQEGREGAGHGDRVAHQRASLGSRNLPGRAGEPRVREPPDDQLMGERQDLPRRPEPAPALRDLRRVRGLSHQRRRGDHERDHRPRRQDHEAPELRDARIPAAHDRRDDMGLPAGVRLGLAARADRAHPRSRPRALGRRNVRRLLGGLHQEVARPRHLRRDPRLLEGRGGGPRHGARAALLAPSEPLERRAASIATEKASTSTANRRRSTGSR